MRSEAQGTEGFESFRAENEALKRRLAEVSRDADQLRAELANTRAFVKGIEQRFLNLLHDVPAGILVLHPPEMIVELANPAYAGLVGNRELIGKRFEEAIPEARPQGLIDLLMRVYTTGEPISGRELQIKIDRDGSGSLTDAWYDFVYQPVRDATGAVSAILCHVVEVTDKVLARRSVEALNEQLRVYKQMLDTALDGICFLSPEGTLTYGNAAFGAMTGFGDRAVGGPLSLIYDREVFETEISKLVASVYERGHWSGVVQARRPDGSAWLAQISSNLLTDAAGAPIGLTGIFRDVTEQTRADAERAELQRQLIESQRATLRELATPLIPLADGVIAMPLIGAVDADRARQIMETLLRGIAAHRARVALLDVTGVRLVDAQTANGLICSAKAAQLLGAEVVLTGLSPEVARTLVELGVELTGIQTRGSFQAGIAYALGRLRGVRAQRAHKQ